MVRVLCYAAAMSAQVIDLVRAETAALHERLESRLDIPAQLEDPGRRARLVGRFWGFYHPVENALEAWLQAVPGLDFDCRRKVPILERDLRVLGLHAEELARFEPPAFAGQAEALGFQYVLEGATLGGRVIRRQAAGRGLALAGLSFFDVYGSETGARWRAFLDVLETRCADQAAEAARGARRGFELIEAWLCRETLTV